MTTVELTTLIIAIYGAILGTISLAASIALGIAEFKRNRPNLRVEARHARIVDRSKGNSEPLISLDAINTSQRAITLTCVGWLTTNKKERLQILSPYYLTFPIPLPEGKSCSAFVPCRIFKQNAQANCIIGLYFKDKTGKEWRGKVSRKDREMWIQAASDGWRLD